MTIQKAQAGSYARRCVRSLAVVSDVFSTRNLVHVFFASLMVLWVVTSSEAADLLKTIPVGSKPGQVVVNPSAHLAYIVNQSGNRVSVIDTQLLKVRATLTVGSSPMGIAANPATNKVYVANSGSGTITPISGVSVLAPWTVGGTPSALVIDAIRNQVYVMDTSRNQILILNATTGAILTSIPTLLQPTAMTINIATHAVFVACSGASGSVVVIDGVHRTVITTISVAQGSTSISVDPATNIVIVESPSTNTHTAINAGSGYSAQTETLDGPLGSAYGGDSEFFVTESTSTIIAFADASTGLFTLGNAYVTNLLGGGGLTANPSSNQMVVLYPATDVAYLIDLNNPLFTQNYHELTAGLYVTGAAFDPLGNKLFVTNSSDNTVSAFDITPRELVDAWENAYGAVGYNFIDANPATGNMYVLRLGNVYAVNEAAAGVGDNGTSQNSAGVTTIPLSSVYSQGIAVNVASNKIYAADGPGGLYLIDGVTNAATLVSGLPVNTQIRAVAMDYATNQMIAWDYYTGNVLILDGATAALLNTVPTNGSGGALQVDSAHNLAYVGGYQVVYVVDLGAGSIVTTIPVPAQVMALALDSVRSRLYAIDNGDHLLVINTSTNTVVTTFTLPYVGVAVAVNPLSGNYYACTFYDVYEYSYSSNTLVQDFSNTAYPAITEAVSLLANPLTDQVYVGTDSGTLSSILAVIDERSSMVSGVADLFDTATHALALDLGTGVIGGAGYTYTQLFFPSSSVNGSDVPITVTGTGVVDAYTIATTPIFRTRNPQPIFTVTATASSSTKSSALVPPIAFYQVDGWQGTWRATSMKLQTGTQTSKANIKLPVAVTKGLHILYVYASDADVATIQAGLPSGNSVANSPVISPVGAIVFTVEQ